MTDIPEKYKPVLDKLRQIYVETGSKLSYAPEDFGCNQYYGSRDGTVQLIFDCGGIHEIKTPEGLLIPLGSRSVGDDPKAFQIIMETFDLELVCEEIIPTPHYGAGGPFYKFKSLDIKENNNAKS